MTLYDKTQRDYNLNNFLKRICGLKEWASQNFCVVSSERTSCNLNIAISSRDKHH